ncbi:methyl-accepting chemotaxis protein [Marinobacter halodurans]|uniref:Methyl-accepting chemotaxis protein n=1 Tax=Marinobacter halodurans TaxID=2528979 RepID=A0ABY1ZNZ6_9GAMM|nr:methyl-accepting chemotaxis protein [Marinobacter halodurans]TBW56882.1 methyl-accepting chemotaxis protein [Marinobacter halodurans]
MNIIRRLGLKTKIVLPFALTALAIIALGVANLITTRGLISDTGRISHNYVPAVSAALNADRDLYQAYTAQQNLILAAQDQEDISGFLADYDENAKQALDRMEVARKLLAEDGVDNELEGFETAYRTWKAAADKVNAMVTDGQVDEARQAIGKTVLPLFSSLRDYYDVAGAFADKNALATSEDATAIGQQSMTTTVVVTVIVLAISGLIFFVATRLIIQSINELRTRLDDIAEGGGDLSSRVPVESNDDLGRLATSFNAVIGNLQGMVREIKDLSLELKEGAEKLDRAAADNRDGITQQTDAITQVATAINQMQSAIEEVAANAGTAADVTRSAQTNTETGARIIHNASEEVNRLSDQIETAVGVIRKLSEDSGNITSVLDVIRGIAEQTNLLALNAAIEAARAGEQGRGFAVVADEVRTLAQRTQESTSDIQSMITTLQTGVSEIVSVMETGNEQAEQTVKLSAEAEQKLNEILGAMNSISDVNASVASATEEQTQVVDEINRSITRINDLAQNSDARSVEIDQISQLLAGYAQTLTTQVGRYRV